MMITIQVLQVPSVMPEAYWNLFLSCVSEERRSQAARFIHQADAYRSVLGEVLTRVTLSDQTGLRAEELSFSRNTYGKPCLTQYPERQFNVSHSGDWVALISDGTEEVGVDVEKIAPIDLQIAERFFSSQENMYLAAQPAENQLDTFYRLWTLKESYIKAIGMGLSMPLNAFAILPSKQQQGLNGELIWRCTQDEYKLNVKQEGQPVKQLDFQSNHMTGHHFYSEPLDAQHMLAACSAGGQLPSEPQFITLENVYNDLMKQKK